MRSTIWICFVAICVILTGCQSSGPAPISEKSKRIEELTREKDSMQYELSLRQTEMSNMETSAKKPGVVGVSSQWLQRHNELKEKVTKLQVRLHEIDTELSALRAKSN